MRKPNLLCVFSFILILFIGLSDAAFAQQSGEIEEGPATWYGSRYHGKRTTSGEIFNKNRMTAAHRTLPFGTRVKVTHLGTNKSVIVRINDRGPFYKQGYIIDVSEAAARKIGMHLTGKAEVTLEVLSDDESGTETTANAIKPLQSTDSTSAASPLTQLEVQANSFEN